MRPPALVTVPHQFADLQFHAPKAGIRFVAATEGVKEPIMTNGRAPMDFEHGASPDFFDAPPVRLDPQQYGANPVIRGGKQNQIIHDNWVHRVYRVGNRGAKPEAEFHRAIGHIE